MHVLKNCKKGNTNIQGVSKFKDISGAETRKEKKLNEKIMCKHRRISPVM